MSKLSNNQGRAYEYVCLIELHKEIKKHRVVAIKKNSSYEASKRAFDTLTPSEKKMYQVSASAMIPAILECEPLIIEKSTDVLELFIQQDEAGEMGDVRDIIIKRGEIKWEIGLSIKHNHFAVKHSRLSSTIDFGKKWFNIPCSATYWRNIEPVFNYLQLQKKNNLKFADLPNKEKDVYIPILKSFITEIKRQNKEHIDLPKKLVEYLLSKYDFYKIISLDKKQLTEIQAFNTHGTLNKSYKGNKPTIFIPIAKLPTQIIKLDFHPERNNTIELYLDEGWYFTFRIHNAETYVTPSLKFDIQLAGMPSSILTINCIWR